VCRCLKVTEEAVIHAIAILGLRTVKEIRQATGAGDGCTCCHKLLLRLIERHGGPAEVPSPALVPVLTVGTL
jgi:NAD(P)H-nitrite reductase large subunit